MKQAIGLFVLAGAWLLLVPFLWAFTIEVDLEKNGLQSAVAQRELAKRTEIILPSGPTTEREIDLDYLSYFNVQDGFQLVHDPNLGQEAFLVGPENIVSSVKVTNGKFNDRTGIYFPQPVRLEAPVKILVNLNEHHVGDLFLAFLAKERQNTFVNFVTRGPIQGRNLTLSGGITSDAAIQMDVQQFNYRDRKEAEIKFSGRADRFDLPRNTGGIDLSELKSQEYATYLDNMNGRLLRLRGIPELQLHYNDRYSYDNNGNQVELRPDTVIVDQNASVKATYRENNAAVAFPELVIIRE